MVRVWAAANSYDIGSAGQVGIDTHPVQAVNWYDAIKWCNARSEMEGLTPVYTLGTEIYRTGEFGEDGSSAINQNASANGYRLPTEAEWEWAARGGTLTHGYTYSGSNTIGNVAWYSNNSAGSALDLYPPSGVGRGTWPVGQKAENELGLYDMSGNVCEWCWDFQSPQFSSRIYRGGSWDNAADRCTVAVRWATSPNIHLSFVGFRWARSAVP